ncbi:MAG: DUF5702 domain-containing protein [Clostridium sp.]|nr:DUF5702 domain-containing protein [Clostridium sp.]
MRKEHGSVTIFLTILLVPMLIVAGVFVDVGRYQLSKAAVTSAADLTLRSYLANYDTALKEVYGLYAVSQKDEGNQNSLYASYFDDNLGWNDQDSMDFLKLYKITSESSDNFSVKGMEGSSLANPDMLKQQIIEYMKYRAPINAGLSLLDCFSSLKKLKPQSNVLKEKTKVDEASADFAEACEEYWIAIKAYEDQVKKYNVNQWKDTYVYYTSQYKKAYRILQETIKLETANEIYWQKFKFKKVYDISKLDVFDSSKDGKFQSAYKQITENKDLGDLKYEEAETYLKDAVQKYKEHVNSLHLNSLNWNKSGELTDSDVTVLQEAFSVLQGSYTTKYMEYLDDFRSICSLYRGMLKTYDDKKTKLQELTKTDIRENALNQKFIAMMSAPTFASEDLKAKVQYMSDAATLWYKERSEQISNLQRSIDNVVNKGETVVKSAQTVNTANNNFRTSISSYNAKSGEDEFSANMKQVHISNKSSFDEKKVTELKKQFDGFKKSAEKISNALNESYYADKKIVDGISNIFITQKAYGKAEADTVRILSFPNEELKTPTGDFYKYLKSTYGSDHKEKDSDKSDKNNLIDTANSMKNNVANTKVDDKQITDTADLPSGLGNTQGGSSLSDYNIGKEFNNFFRNFSGIFDSLGDLIADPGDGLVGMRDDLYVINYAMNNFSYYTQEKELKIEASESKSKKNEKPQTFSGVPINADTNVMYQGEIEYILYGNNSVQANVNEAKGNIFIIRMVINSIFALTDSGINSTTSKIAAGLSFIIPPIITQVILDVTLACAESSIDIMRMENGEKIEIFKSKETFILSPGNISSLSLLKDNLKKFTKEKINNAIDSGDHALTGAVNKVVDNTMDNVKIKTEDFISDIGQSINKKLFEQANSLFESMRVRSFSVIDNALMESTDISTLKSLITAKLDTMALDLQKSIETYDGLAGIEGLSGYIDSYKEEIRTEILKNVDSLDKDNISKMLKEKATTIINQKIDSFSRVITGKITSIANKEIESLRESIKSKAGEYIDTGAEGVRKSVIEVTDKSLDKLFPKSNGDLKLSGDGSSKNGTFKDALKMGYSDYLQVFYFGKLNADETLIMKRMADLIQINLRNTNEKSAIVSFKPITDFKMKKAFTYTELKTDLGMKTIFIGTDWFKNKTGKEKDKFDFSFQTILGYS